MAAVWALMLLAASAALPAEGHAYSAVTLQAVEAGDTAMAAAGAALWLDGQPLGPAPCALHGLYDEGRVHLLEARGDGWQPAARRLALPADGVERIAVARASAGNGWSLAGLGVGAALAAASLLAYPHDAGAGAALLAGGLAATGLGQWAAWGGRASAHRRAEAQNAAWDGGRP